MYKSLCFFILFFPFFCWGQESEQLIKSPDKILVQAVIYKGETIPYIVLSPVICTAKRKFKNHREQVKWTRLLYNVKVVYPYAILASARLKEYESVLAKMPEGERKKYMRDAEKKLQAEFGEDLKNLTITQGRILIKLIDRETGRTSYDLIKEMRGSFSAFMWQSLASLFNSSLKDDYDAAGEDRAIEQAIKLIENGYF